MTNNLTSYRINDVPTDILKTVDFIFVSGFYIPDRKEEKPSNRKPNGSIRGGHGCCCESVCPCYPHYGS